jgi:hypothetical protein
MSIIIEMSGMLVKLSSSVIVWHDIILARLISINNGTEDRRLIFKITVYNRDVVRTLAELPAVGANVLIRGELGCDIRGRGPHIRVMELVVLPNGDLGNGPSELLVLMSQERPEDI